jgi:hypothetical protein
MLKRVKKSDVVPDSWVKPDGLLYCLDCWQEWMHGDADRDLGAKPMGGLAGDADGYGISSAEQQQARNNRIAVATDAMIDSLKRIHIWAIYTSCSVGKVWNYPNADLISVAEEARVALTEKLKKNICTGVLF